MIAEQPLGGQSPQYVTVGLNDSLWLWCDVNYMTTIIDPSSPPQSPIPIPLLEWENLTGLDFIFDKNSTDIDSSTSLSIKVQSGLDVLPSVTCAVYFTTPVVFAGGAFWSSTPVTISCK